MKTLKREEIYANDYVNLEHLRRNIEIFIEDYYNRCRLHSALAYQPPEEFAQQLEFTTINAGATMSFSGMGRTINPWQKEARPADRSLRPNCGHAQVVLLFDPMQ